MRDKDGEKVRAQGVTDAVMSALRLPDLQGRDITSRVVLKVVQTFRAGFGGEQLPAITMALCAAERAGLIEKVDGRKGSRNVWRHKAQLEFKKVGGGALLVTEQVEDKPARADELLVPLSAVVKDLPEGHPLRLRHEEGAGDGGR